MADNEVEGSIELGTPKWLGFGASFSLRMKRTWETRGASFMHAVGDGSGLGPEELQAACEADETLGDVLHAAGQRAQTVADPDYRDSLARVVAAAFQDDAVIDETVMLVDDLVGLGPAHLRVLRLLGDTPYPAQMVPAAGLTIDGVVAALERLAGAGFAYEATEQQPSVQALEALSQLDGISRRSAAPGPPMLHARRWKLTPWGRRALELVAAT